jgi:hypothetical protein
MSSSLAHALRTGEQNLGFILSIIVEDLTATGEIPKTRRALELLILLMDGGNQNAADTEIFVRYADGIVVPIFQQEALNQHLSGNTQSETVKRVRQLCMSM